ncbi:MAG: hypothetical protein ACR2QC_07760 [Gammaproteobacteria bacterium]
MTQITVARICLGRGTMSAPDWRILLRKYIAYIRWWEGSDGLVTKTSGDPDIPQEEWDLLKGVAEEIDSEKKTRR